MKLHRTLYNFYGVYIDWQIDYNLLPKVFVDRDVNNINNYNDFIYSSQWQIQRILIDKQYYLIFDIDLPHFSLKTYRRLDTELIMENIKGTDLPKEIAKCSKELNLPILDVISFYLSHERSVLEVSVDAFLSDYQSDLAMIYH